MPMNTRFADIREKKPRTWASDELEEKSGELKVEVVA